MEETGWFLVFIDCQNQALQVEYWRFGREEAETYQMSKSKFMVLQAFHVK